MQCPWEEDAFRAGDLGFRVSLGSIRVRETLYGNLFRSHQQFRNRMAGPSTLKPVDPEFSKLGEQQP